jgi:hypothetical protein
MPGPGLLKPIPRPEPVVNIRRLVRELIKEELSIRIWNSSNDTISAQLILGEEYIGNEFKLDTTFYTDHGHGGGRYVGGLKVKHVE